ncbi:unnamed protein product [Malus baccata var. baccata]
MDTIRSYKSWSPYNLGIGMLRKKPIFLSTRPLCSTDTTSRKLLFGQTVYSNRKEASFIDQVWDNVLKVHMSIKVLKKNLQVGERVKLARLNERMKTVEGTFTRFENSTVRAPLGTTNSQ